MRPIKFIRRSPTYHLGFRTTKRTLSFETSGTMLTVAIKVFLFSLLTTLFDFHTPHVLPAAEVDVSLTLNYPLTSLIFHIDVNKGRRGSGWSSRRRRGYWRGGSR